MAKANAPQENLLSFKLDSFISGGLLPDGKYILRNAKVVEWDYDGKSPTMTCALSLDCFPIEVDSKGTIKEVGEARKQYYSAGDVAKIGPNLSGTGFVARGETRGLSDSSNLHVFLKNLAAAGFDEFDNDVSAFDEMGVEIVNMNQPKREGLPASNLVQAGGPPKPERERTIPVVKVIGKMPGEKKWNMGAVGAKPASTAPATTAAANGKANGKATPEPEVEEGGDEGIEALVAGFIAPIVEGKATTPRTSIRVGVFQAMGKAGKTNDEKKAATAIINDDDQLGNILMTIGGGYSIDGANVVSLG